MTLGDQCFKRVIFGDAWLAHSIEQNLEAFADTALFPPLVGRYEREIWVEYVEGDQPDAADGSVIERIGDFYATLYGRGAQRVALESTPIPARLARDLRFLARTGVVTMGLSRELEQASRRLAPAQAWVGFDYIDPVLKNFVAVPGSGRLCAVDIESLSSGQLLGSGVAKALHRWAKGHREDLLRSVLRAGVPDFGSYFAYVELAFVASYTAMMVLERKWKYVDPASLERFGELS